MGGDSMRSNIEKQEKLELLIEVALKKNRRLISEIARRESRENVLKEVLEVLENPQHKYHCTPLEYIKMLLRELDES